MTERVEVADASAISEARRLTRARAQELGLDAHAVERAVLVASEAATNLHRHAVNGRFFCTQSLGGELVLLSIDEGPGMENPARMQQDGVSTGDSLGVGLGAMERQSDRFELWSAAGVGTVALAAFAIPGAPKPPRGLDLDGLRVAAPHQPVCGDSFSWRRMEDGVQIFLCDGFGHGPVAARDAERLRIGFVEGEGPAPAVLDAMCHLPDVERGAVALVVDYAPEDAALTAAGVGNISGAILTREETRRIVSREGSVGRRCVVRPERYDLPAGALLLLHSDGLKTFRRTEAHRHLFYRSSLMTAAIIMRESLRGPDDASIIVMRTEGETDD